MLKLKIVMNVLIEKLFLGEKLNHFFVEVRKRKQFLIFKTFFFFFWAVAHKNDL